MRKPQTHLLTLSSGDPGREGGLKRGEEFEGRPMTPHQGLPGSFGGWSSSSRSNCGSSGPPPSPPLATLASPPAAVRNRNRTLAYGGNGSGGRGLRLPVLGGPTTVPIPTAR